MEMDIYMRRRLVALGGLVAFFILFVLLVKSCGDDDEPETPLTPVAGATDGGGAVALTSEEFIAEADAICAQSNSAVAALDPADTQEPRKEFQITNDEYQQIQALNVDDSSGALRRFMAAFGQVVDALRAKSQATARGDTAGADAAQVELDTAEAEARQLGEQYGFADCGQWLDAGQSPTTGGADTGTATTPSTGGVAPSTDTGDTTVTPPATDTGTDTGGDTGDTGGVSP